MSFLNIRALTCPLALMMSLCLVGIAWSEEEDKGKKKDEPKGNVIQIDLSQLPPDLVKQLMKYVKKEHRPSKKLPKDPPAVAKAKGSSDEIKLPPGLANKPKDHPGRVNYIKHVLGKKADAEIKLPPGLAKKPKDHPGRVNYIKHVLGKKAGAEMNPSKSKGKPEKKKKGKDGDEGENLDE